MDDPDGHEEPPEESDVIPPCLEGEEMLRQLFGFPETPDEEDARGLLPEPSLALLPEATEEYPPTPKSDALPDPPAAPDAPDAPDAPCMTMEDWAAYDTPGWDSDKWNPRDVARFLAALPQAPKEAPVRPSEAGTAAFEDCGARRRKQGPHVADLEHEDALFCVVMAMAFLVTFPHPTGTVERLKAPGS